MIMDGRTLSILILILPALIYGLQCDLGGTCKTLFFNGQPTFEKGTTICPACVRFLCPTGGNKMSYGAGCYEDFVKVCKWVPTDIRMQIEGSYMNESYSYHDDTIIFASSNNSTEIASDTMNELSKELNAFKHEFRPIPGPHKPPKKCIYDSNPKPLSNGNVTCSVRLSTFTAEEFCLKDNAIPSTANKSCLACVSWMYTTADKNQLTFGNGCLEDFEMDKQSTIPAKVKTMVKNNVMDSYLVGENYVVRSCNDKNDCSYGASQYNVVNHQAYSNFLHLFDKECKALQGDAAANATTSTTTTVATTTSKGIQTATFGLTGIAMSALMYILL